jgi:hypothetical protein
MTTYINLTTGEYPRYPGDIELAPNNQFVAVEWVDPPPYSFPPQICYEGSPINENGVWRMTWIVRDATQEELNDLADDQRKKHGWAINR